MKYYFVLGIKTPVDTPAINVRILSEILLILEKFIKPEKNIVKPIAGTKIVFIAYKFPLKLNY